MTSRRAEAETGSQKDPAAEAEELRNEIERTREELGDTVEALAHKADVRAHAQEKVAEIKQQAAQAKERPFPVAAVVLGVVIAAGVLWRLRSR